MKTALSISTCCVYVCSNGTTHVDAATARAATGYGPHNTATDVAAHLRLACSVSTCRQEADIAKYKVNTIRSGAAARR